MSYFNKVCENDLWNAVTGPFTTVRTVMELYNVVHFKTNIQIYRKHRNRNEIYIKDH
jgi:hypothetical protein